MFYGYGAVNGETRITRWWPAFRKMNDWNGATHRCRLFTTKAPAMIAGRRTGPNAAARRHPARRKAVAAIKKSGLQRNVAVIRGGLAGLALWAKGANRRPAFWFSCNGKSGNQA
jgi:hypothetical protein